MRPTGTAILRGSILTACGLALTACATATPTQSGFLSDYSQLQPRTDVVRAKVSQYRDEPLLQATERVRLEPAIMGEGVATGFSPEEIEILLWEVDRQICYKMSRRFSLADDTETEAARLRVTTTRVLPTNAVGSAASAVVDRFIPGPIGLRVPGSTGGLAAEAELVTADGRQAAAVIWARDAQVIGTENPSLSRVGDAHQLAGAFADIVTDAVTPQERDARPVPDPDPCARFGQRIRPEGFVTRFVTGLYSPTLSGGAAQSDETPSAEPEETDPN